MVPNNKLYIHIFYAFITQLTFSSLYGISKLHGLCASFFQLSKVGRVYNPSYWGGRESQAKYSQDPHLNQWLGARLSL
jgi:hypothetical protein